MGPMGVALVRLISLVSLRVRGRFDLSSHPQNNTVHLQSVMI